MPTSALMSKLEAVNIILAAIEEAPVGSLALTGIRPLAAALDTLTEASRLVQSPGWKFNTEYEFPLTRSSDGTISLPESTLHVDVDDKWTDVDPVLRGSRLYDSKAHSYSFQADLTATVVVMLDWDELPQAARQFIAITASKTLQGRSSISDSAYRYNDSDVQGAKVAFMEQEASAGDHNILRDSQSTASILFGHSDYL